MSVEWSVVGAKAPEHKYYAKVRHEEREVFLVFADFGENPLITLRGVPADATVVLKNVLTETTVTLPPGGGVARSGELYTITALDLLRRLGCSINRNLIELSYSVGGGASVACPTLLHVIRQELTVLLGGVLATQLRVQNSQLARGNGMLSQNWPCLFEHFRGGLSELACDARGIPIHRVERMSVIAGTYKVAAIEKALNEGCPQIECAAAGPPGWFKRNDRIKVPHYHLQLYPYDWRLDFFTLIETLLGPQAPLPAGTELFADNPVHTCDTISLRTIRHEFAQRPEYFFVSKKVNISGHSTGGVVINGLIRTEGVQELIQRVFFLSAAFLGTYKAFYSMIRGTMELGPMLESIVLSSKEWRELTPNMPIVYGLAWNGLFTSTVEAEGQVAKYHDASAFASKAIKLENNVRPVDKPASWNIKLWANSIKYRNFWATTNLKIPVTRCLVFYSDFDPNKRPAYQRMMSSGSHTLGEIHYRAGQPDITARIAFDVLEGDGTVTRQSLRGEARFAGQVRQIPGNVDHVSAANDPYVWNTVREAMKEDTNPPAVTGAATTERVPRLKSL